MDFGVKYKNTIFSTAVVNPRSNCGGWGGQAKNRADILEIKYNGMF